MLFLTHSRVLATTEAAKLPELPPHIPYQGTVNTLGIFMVFWSFQRLFRVLLRSSDYKDLLTQQSELLRNQSRMLENQNRVLMKLSATVSRLSDTVRELT